MLSNNVLLRYYANTMNKKARNFLLGVGSVIDIAPCIDLRLLAPRKTTAERMSGHFIKVGASMRRASGAYENNDKTVNYRKEAT